MQLSIAYHIMQKPETTVRDVNNFLMPRLNRTVKIEQMRTKYDEYSSFKLCVPTYLKNKVLDKNFWGNNDIYVRNFVQKNALLITVY